MFAGVGERTREGNDLWLEMTESGVIGREKHALVYGQMNEPPGSAPAGRPQRADSGRFVVLRYDTILIHRPSPARTLSAAGASNSYTPPPVWGGVHVHYRPTLEGAGSYPGRRRCSTNFATSASSPTWTPARPRPRSGSSTTAAPSTRSATSMTATPPPTSTRSRRQKGITINCAAVSIDWGDNAHQHHRHPRPRRLHGRGRALPARPRRRASASSAPSAASRCSPRRSGTRPTSTRCRASPTSTSSTAWAPTSWTASSR